MLKHSGKGERRRGPEKRIKIKVSSNNGMAKAQEIQTKLKK